MADAAQVHMFAASNAADLGLRALADLAEAAEGHDYRVVGGHMVHILTQVCPTPDAVARVTADADAGIDTVVAGNDGLHESLLARGYELVKGNHYEALSGVENKPLEIDLLVPLTTGQRRETVVVGDRGFDAIPGLSLALSAEALDVTVHASLQGGGKLTFDVRLPDVEAAVVLKALTWQSRLADKDIADLCSLLTIVHQHKDQLRTGWKLNQPKKGTRGDAARALHTLLEMIDRRQRIGGLTMAAPRLGALIRTHVSEPPH